MPGNDFIRQKPIEKHKGYLSIDEVTYQFRRYDGTMSPPQTREVMRRGDAAAVLAYNRDLQQVILVEQFRIATVRDDRPGEGWLLELPAGVIREQQETPVECARRELAEETGYELRSADPKEDKKQLDRFQHIATVLPSAGGSTERIFIYFVEVGNADNTGSGGGERSEGEDIRLVPVSPENLAQRLRSGDLRDAKLHIAAQWLQGHPPNRHQPPPETFRYVWREDRDLPAGEQRLIGIKSGGINDVSDVDIWVNSENTDMLMDRFFGTSVSATIRFLGAEKHRNGTIYRDTIAEALKSRLGGQIFVKPATVIVTPPGQLRRAPHRVRRIFHVAAVQALQGKGLYANVNVSVECLNNALLQAEALNWGHRRVWGIQNFLRPFRSIVVPLLGAGQGGVTSEDVVRALVPAAIDFFRKHDDAMLREIYFIAFRGLDLHLLRTELGRHGDTLIAP